VAPELGGLLVDNKLTEDCAIVGVWDEEITSEDPRVCCAEERGGRLAGKEVERGIIEWTREKMTAHKRLGRRVRVVEGIPKSICGKILRRCWGTERRREGGREGKRGSKGEPLDTDCYAHIAMMLGRELSMVEFVAEMLPPARQTVIVIPPQARQFTE